MNYSMWSSIFILYTVDTSFEFPEPVRDTPKMSIDDENRRKIWENRIKIFKQYWVVNCKSQSENCISLVFIKTKHCFQIFKVLFFTCTTGTHFSFPLVFSCFTAHYSELWTREPKTAATKLRRLTESAHSFGTLKPHLCFSSSIFFLI